MIDQTEALQNKFFELLRWQRRKRREQVAVAIACYSLIAALLLVPVSSLLPATYLRWLVPLPFMVLSAPLILYRQRWRRRDAARSLADVDKLLRLDERAITAWELLERKDTRATALLVVNQAAEKLKARDFKALLPRQRSWHHFIVPLLTAVWFLLVWFKVDLLSVGGVQSPTPKTIAHQLRDFSRELQHKAASEGLRKTLTLGRDLEKVAQKGIEAKTSDEQFKREVAGMNLKVKAAGKAAAKEPSFSTAEGQQSLKDLKAEIEAAQEPLQSSDGTTSGGMEQQWLDRMATLPQLKRQFDQQRQHGQSFSQGEMKSFLDKLNQQVTGELDRRSLLDAQEFLEQLAKQGQRQTDESNARLDARGEEDGSATGDKTQNQSNRPGSEPGSKEEIFQALRQFPDLPATHLKGSVGEGSSSAVELKGKPTNGSSVVGQDEVVANYRRRAEQELNTERVPEELKETVKKYFMSLRDNR